MWVGPTFKVHEVQLEWANCGYFDALGCPTAMRVMSTRHIPEEPVWLSQPQTQQTQQHHAAR